MKQIIKEGGSEGRVEKGVQEMITNIKDLLKKLYRNSLLKKCVYMCVHVHTCMCMYVCYLNGLMFLKV